MDEISKKMISEIDIDGLSKLSVFELKMRNALIHPIVQKAIIENLPQREGLNAQQKAINYVLVSKTRKKSIGEKISLDSLKMDLRK